MSTTRERRILTGMAWSFWEGRVLSTLSNLDIWSVSIAGCVAGWRTARLWDVVDADELVVVASVSEGLSSLLSS